MKNLFFLFCLLFLIQSEGTAQTELDLTPSQSMIMTGKGQGQDATINPYFGQNCYSIVENIGEGDFSIRIQQRGKIIEIIHLSKGGIKK